jgi:hypothetical protein
VNVGDYAFVGDNSIDMAHTSDGRFTYVNERAGHHRPQGHWVLELRRAVTEVHYLCGTGCLSQSSNRIAPSCASPAGTSERSLNNVP